MFNVPAQFTGASHKVDGSMSARFTTGELTAKYKLQLIEHLNLAGWLQFSEDKIIEVPKEDSGFEEGKSPSERLRSIIYVYWKEKMSDKEPIFDTFYKKAVEKQIEAYKTKLNN